MRTYIQKIQDQAPVAPLLSVKARDNFDRSLKSRNFDFYYSHMYMECYYFCQQYKDYFEIAGSQGYKRVFFATGFLKDCILNRWQQHKTRM